jgi:flagellar motor switch protein FliN/FliY
MSEFSQADIDSPLADAGAGAETDSTPAPEPQPAPQPDARLDTAGRPFDETAAAMAAATEAAQAVPAGRPLDLPDFTGGADAESWHHGIDLLHDVGLRVKIELGRTRMFVEDVLKLGDGSVVELDKLAGDPVDVFANDQLIARGEVLILNDNFCVRVSEIISGGAATALKT